MNVAIKSGIDLKLVEYASRISQKLMIKMREMGKISKLPSLKESVHLQPDLKPDSDEKMEENHAVSSLQVHAAIAPMK